MAELLEWFDRLNRWTQIGLLFGVPLVLATLAAFVARLLDGRGRRRERELQSVAAELALAFLPEGSAQMPLLFARLSRGMFGLPVQPVDDLEVAVYGRYYHDGGAIHGRFKAREVLAFDACDPTAEASRAADGCRQDMSMLTVIGDEKRPHLVIRPERWDDRLAASLGIDDVDFESNREFSDRFYVYCRDESFARRFVTPEAMSYLLANPGWYIEMCGSDALIYDLRIWKPARFKEALEVLGGFLDLASAPTPDDAAAGRPAGCA